MSITMKIYEIISEYISKSKIIEMALERKELESNITSLADPVIEHLIKVLKWRDEQNYIKHIRDINNWLRKIQRYRRKGNKKPTQLDYFNWIFDDVVHDERTLELWIDSLKQYKNLPELRTDSEVFDTIKGIIYQVSYELPLDKFENIQNYLPD